MTASLKTQIVRYRAKHDMSQVEFAARVGISATTLVAIEKGNKKNISRLTKAKIKMVLDEPEDTYHEEV